MHLRLILQQSRPELLGELLLLQHQLDVPRGVVSLRLLRVDLGVELQLDGVVGLLCRAVAGEVEVGGLDVELQGLGIDVGDGDGEENVVLLRVGLGGALGPGD